MYAKDVRLGPLAILQGQQRVNCALLVNTTLLLDRIAAESALGEPIPLPAKVLARCAVKENSLLLGPLRVLLALLDTTQIKLGIEFVQHVQSALNALGLQPQPQLFALPALSNQKLDRPPVLHALGKPISTRLELKDA